jgi:cysteinyl-tRNA synthetase
MIPTLRLTNTLTRRKEEFRPLDPTHIRMYACGPTVYDFAHIGNARPVIVFDLLFRLLRQLARQGAWDDGRGETRVTYVRNVTDVDDRINARAFEKGISIRELTDGTLAQFHEDIAALGVLMPGDHDGDRLIEPRATDHVDTMRDQIDALVRRGHAYVAADHVLFDVPSMPDYGALSNRPLDEMEAGARVDVAPYKRSPLDFVLWKPSKPGEPSWPSPAGIEAAGRPGWHIECSAMAWRHLGERFDIHAGGLDLIFPHHENEIAQSRCCYGTDAMATTWLHNGFLQVEGAKMSKSAGNFTTIRDVLKDWPGEVVRLAMLRTHYRQPIDWTARGLEESERVLRAWSTALALGPTGPDIAPGVLDALCDDLNTPRMLAELHALERAGRVDLLGGTLSALGFSGAVQRAEPEVDRVEVGRLIDLRLAARAGRNWAESDRIRDELKAMGVQVKDNKDGTATWEVVRG